MKSKAKPSKKLVAPDYAQKAPKDVGAGDGIYRAVARNTGNGDRTPAKGKK